MTRQHANKKLMGAILLLAGLANCGASGGPDGSGGAAGPLGGNGGNSGGTDGSEGSNSGGSAGAATGLPELSPEQIEACLQCAKDHPQCGCLDDCVPCLYKTDARNCDQKANYYNSGCVCLHQRCGSVCPYPCVRP